MAESTEGSLPPQDSREWETARRRVESVVNAQNPDKTPEDKSRLVDLTRKKLDVLASSPQVKVVIQGELRTVEPPDSETPGEGLSLETVNSLFDLGFEPHNINYLTPDDDIFQVISNGLQKPVSGMVVENGVQMKGPFQPAPRIPAS